MCLITEEKQTRITPEDMVVWKSMSSSSGGTFSPYNDYEYIPGQLLKESIKIQDDSFDDRCYCDSIAGDAYGATHIPPWELAGYYIQCKISVVSVGFHSCATKERAKNLSGNSILPFFIPAGSEIITDKTGLIVSNQIMLIPESDYEKYGIKEQMR